MILVVEEICAFCKQFDLGTDGFICQKTGQPISKDDTCEEIEVVK